MHMRFISKIENLRRRKNNFLFLRRRKTNLIFLEKNLLTKKVLHFKNFCAIIFMRLKLVVLGD